MRLVAVLALIALLAGCSDPKSELVPSGSPSTWPKDFAITVADLSEEEHTLFLHYVARRSLDSVLDEDAAKPKSLTVGEAIVQEREILAASRRRAGEGNALPAPMDLKQEAQMLHMQLAATDPLGAANTDDTARMIDPVTPWMSSALRTRDPSTSSMRSIRELVVFRDVLDGSALHVIPPAKEYAGSDEHRASPAYAITLNTFIDGQAPLARIH